MICLRTLPHTLLTYHRRDVVVVLPRVNHVCKISLELHVIKT